MLNIYIVRHGQNLDNANGIFNGHRDEPLTDLGKQQAVLLGERIKESGLHFDKIYSSPLQRAKQTAAAITSALEIGEAEILDDLIERDFGVMTGKPIADIERLCAPDIIKVGKVTYFLDAPKSETFPQLLLRARRVLDFIKARYADGNILLVASGDIGKMIYAAYYQIDWAEALRAFNFSNSEMICLSPEHPQGKIVFEDPNPTA